MEFRSDQSTSVVDFDLIYPDGSRGALEATGSVDARRLQTQARIRKGGTIVPRARTRNDWLVFPTIGADIRRIRESIDDYLAAVEEDGLTQFHTELDSDRYRSVQRIRD